MSKETNVSAKPHASGDRVIRTIRVLSMGSCEAHPEHIHGTWMPRMLWVLTARSWVKVAVQFFVIEHRDGLVLVDTGLDPAIATDPNYISSPIGRFLLHRIFRIHIDETETLDRKLREAGYTPEDVRKAVFTHLHFDHVGGIAHIPQAELVVNRQEWDILSEPHPEHEWILREHIEIPGAKWRPVDLAPTNDPLFAAFGGYYDVMGDGSMILLPTPGHTRGSISILVRAGASAPILLIGDLAYSAENLLKDQVPGTGDAKVLRQSYAKVCALKDALPDLVIVASHDRTAPEKIKAALAEI